jgi:hypothetical protein
MARAKFPSCKNCNDCDDLLSEIQRRMHSTEAGGDKGLLTRLREQIYGCQTPQNTVSGHAACAGHRMVGTWNGHNKAIQDQHDRLRDAVDDYDDNDCGDQVADPEAAQRFMRSARRAAYKSSHQVAPGDYQGPPAPANFQVERNWGQWASDQARGLCTNGLRAGGTIVGGVAGGVYGAGQGALIGGGGGTLVAPGVGTLAGGGGGALIGGGTGAVLGGGAGYLAGDGIANWVCN